MLIATTNTGIGFKTSLGDDVFKERFLITKTDENIDNSIIKSAINLYEEELNLFSSIVNKFSTLYVKGEFKKSMNFRFSKFILDLRESDTVSSPQELLDRFKDKLIGVMLGNDLDIDSAKASLDRYFSCSIISSNPNRYNRFSNVL